MGTAQTKIPIKEYDRQKLVKNEKIGEGNYGKVYDGYDVSNPLEKVAIKEFKSRDDFETEFETASTIKTFYDENGGCPPFFMCMIDYVNDPYAGRYFIIYKRMDMNVTDYMKTMGAKNRGKDFATPLNPIHKEYAVNVKDQDIYNLANMLVTTLETLESLEIAHRDIKMSNILIKQGEHGNIDFVLGDMGFVCKKKGRSIYAKKRTLRKSGLSLNTCETYSGTEEFFHPLFFWGLRDTYLKSTDPLWQDIYSSGATIYSFITGLLPRSTEGSPMLNLDRDLYIKNIHTDIPIKIPGKVINKLVNTMVFSRTYRDALKFKAVWRRYKNLVTRRIPEKAPVRRSRERRPKKKRSGRKKSARRSRRRSDGRRR